jgi:hypothetical protein
MVVVRVGVDDDNVVIRDRLDHPLQVTNAESRVEERIA